MSLSHTRSIITGILTGDITKANFSKDPHFALSLPDSCEGVPSEILNPINTWSSADDYNAKAKALIDSFRQNFKRYEEGCGDAVKAVAL